jgi:hypothetical protein
MARSITGAVVCAVLGVALCAGAALCAGCCANSTSCATAASSLADNALTAEEVAAGWTLLFDGNSFDGWGCTSSDFPGWSLKDGAIACARECRGYLYTQKQFTNFDLSIDFMVDRGTNSGVFFRWAELSDPVQTGFEMQVLDSAGKNTPPGKHDCGALYDILAPSENAMKPANEWNTAVISCRNSFITITLNGARIIRADLNKYTEPHKNLDGSDNKYGRALKDYSRTGRIGLQAHGGAVWYKNVKIRQIK